MLDSLYNNKVLASNNNNNNDLDTNLDILPTKKVIAVGGRKTRRKRRKDRKSKSKKSKRRYNSSAAWK